MRAGRRTGRHATSQSKRHEPDGGAAKPADPSAPADSPARDEVPPERTRWFSRPYARMAVITGLTVAVVVTVTPANGAATDIATKFAHDVRQLVAPSRTAKPFVGTAAVGALFTTAPGGKLSSHFCTASVIHSPGLDLLITAAHCVTGVTGTIDFVPGYREGAGPYGIWQVTKVYADSAWNSSQSQDDDVAFLKVSKPGSSTPIEDVTGAEQLATGRPLRELVEVIGYPDSSDAPLVCENWTSQPMQDQLEFDCGGYTNGTSGGPFLANVDQANGQGTVIGVIGGYQQGGLTPEVSYSAAFGGNVAVLYHQAVAGG